MFNCNTNQIKSTFTQNGFAESHHITNIPMSSTGSRFQHHH